MGVHISDSDSDWCPFERAERFLLLTWRKLYETKKRLQLSRASRRPEGIAGRLRMFDRVARRRDRIRGNRLFEIKALGV